MLKQKPVKSTIENAAQIPNLLVLISFGLS